MTKLFATALLSVGFAAAAMAADMPKSAAPMSADAPAAAKAPAKTAGKGKYGGSGKHSGKKSPAPTSK